MSDHDPLDTELQQRQSLESAQERELQRAQEAEDLRWVMSDARGRRVLWGLLAATGVFRLSFNGTFEGTTFNEGQRNIGLKILNDLNSVCPEKYLLMSKEARTHAKRRNTRT